MHAWLKRAVAGLLSAVTLLGGGLLTAGTANADEIRMPDIGKTITSLTASAATTYPRELVNGGFDYLPAGGWNVISPKLNTSRGKFTSVDPVNGQYIRNAYVTDGNAAWVKWDGFDASKFGWISDQKGGKPQGFVTDHANSVELQRDNDTDNTYAEIVGSEIGKSIYQKIDTQNSTDAVYTVRFDHAALSSEHADGMQALVNGKPVTMTRIGGNKAGDKTGWTGTDIVTHATNTDHYRHDGQWATYEGKVTIPANTPVSTFTFKSLNEAKPDMGNLIDNLTFKIAYRLSYDSNGGTKAKASQISSRTEGKASETDGKVKTVADDAAGRTVLECKRSGEGATGPYADKFCWIDWSNLPLNRTGEPIPVRINVPDGHIDADATVAHTDNAALTAKDYTGNKWSRLIPAYRLTGNTALAFTHIQGNSADPLASVMFSNITPVANQTATSVNVLKDFQLAFGDAETMSGYVVNDKKIYEQTDIESDKTLDKLGMIGDNNPNQSYSEANTGYGTTHVTLAGGPAGAHALTDEADSKGAAVIGATQPTRFKVSFKQVNHPADDSWSAIAIGVYMPYLTAYPLTYDKNGRDATGSVPSNENAGAVKQAKSKTNGSVRLAADDDVAEYAANGLPDHLVNGTFDYRGNEIINENQRVYGRHDTTYLAIISAKTGIIGNPLHSKLDNWDSGKFGWRSNDDTAGVDTVEVQRRNHTPYPTNAGNVWGEIAAAKRGKYIYQDIATTPGIMYKWSLKHASRNADQDDSMQVMIGEPGKTVAQQATRTTSNGSDKTGSAGTTITTHGTAQDGKWETYTGDYLATSTTTRFTFRSVRDSNGQGLDFTAEGNCVDDLSFDKAYKLSYDKNSSDATGSVPSNQYGKENTVQPAKSKTAGSVELAANKTASGLTVHDLKKNDKGKVPSSSKADSTQPAAFKAPDAKAETIASRAAGDELAVNGGFDTPKWTIAKEGQGLPWVYVTPNAGTIRSYAQAMAGQTGVKAGGLTAATFAWQDLDAIGSIQNFELHREKDGNTAADVHAGRTVAQTVNTTPGASYTFSIRHSGRSKGNAGGVTLLTGPDKDHLTPVRLTRTTVSKTGAKYGDKIGDVGTVAYTHSDSTDATEGSHDPWDHSDDWESYEGTVVIPAGQTRTMIAYKGAGWDGTDAKTDSIIDDLSFRLSYRLGYDANGGEKKNTSKTKASTDGAVKQIAAVTSKVPVHDLETTDVPANYRNFTFDTTKTRLSDARFDADWTTTRDEAGGSIHWPTRLGAKATLPNVGAWTDQNGTEHRISATIALKQWNGGNIGQLNRFDANGKIVGDGLFWINVVYDNKQPPASVRKTLGNIDTSKRVGCQWTVSFTYADGTPVPDTFRGVTGFNDLDGFDAQPDLRFEGVQLLSGFDGAYKTRDAELAPYGTNGYAGIKHDAGDESNLNGAQQVRHRLAATWTGPTFTYSYDLRNPAGRADGVRMTFGMPVTRTQILTYKANGGTGQVPSRTETGRTETAASGTDGTVRLAADKSAEPESGTIADDRRVLTDTTARQDDGTAQRTITRSDGSVRVETIADTGAVSGCQVYYPAGTRITLATAKKDADCWDSSQIGKANRTFYGWSANTDANGRDVPVGDTMDRNTLDANVRTEIVMPARAKTVYALWAVNPTLSYNVNTPAGSNAPGTPASRTVAYNTAAHDTSGWAAGDTGKIPGYRFDGWYTAPDGGGRYDFNTPLTNNVTVYAHWIGNGYTVRFTGNGATGGNTPDQAFQYNIGQNLRRNGFVRDGYTFNGWKRADNQQAYGDGQWVTNLTTQPNGIVTMVAQWSANEAHIRYNPNPPAGKTTGGQGTPNWDGHTGDAPAIGQNGWTIDGYTFAGWTTNPDGSGAKYAPGARWTANGTLTLYAQWTPGQASLTYDGNGATGGKTDPQNGVTDQKVNVRQNGFTRDGYAFTGWNTQPDGRGQAWAPNAVWTLHGTGVLYARWRGNQQVLKYYGNGATGGSTAQQEGRTGDVIDTRANGFTRDGYTFVEWNTKPDGTGDHYGKGTNGIAKWTMLPAGNDLYAIWQANPANIQYRDDWGATGSTPDTTGVTGQNVTIAQNGFTRPGYTFTGWARDRRTNPSIQPGSRYTLTPGTTTLWAQWKADPAHLIYNSNSGSTSQTRRTDGTVDQTVTVIANPFTRPGYTFTGWNTQADGRGKAYTAGNGFRLAADPKSNPANTSVLYAQWRINRVTLKFNPNGGTGGYPDITVDAFTTVTIPADAKEPKVQRPGFRFTGWAMKPTPGNGDTILTPGKGTVSMPDQGSITVYAQWAPAMTTLPFTGGHAQVPTLGLYAGLAFTILAMGALMPVIRLRMAAARRGRHAGGTGTAGRHAR
ncbi:InlB B-repeat-containing protein [Bifidobacterium breve]|uniref:InlB B-repeat-containing protein n=1 Tax=Bifidobacterium breve TaxID=1685 RepID=UPI0029C37879|nr:InlB B-repeat-containing protein [Bifidobacterium breve]MDX5146110.1 InlB B-repeat-containing protein [Bifidobacterium breve]